MSYSAFDYFLDRDTWHTFHHNDQKIFFQVLHRVIREPSFDPDKLREYMREKKDVSDEHHPFSTVIDEYVSKASAVKEYLKANNI